MPSFETRPAFGGSAMETRPAFGGPKTYGSAIAVHSPPARPLRMNGRHSPPDEPRVEAIGPIGDGRKVSELALVIKALGVPHGISSRADGYYFLVPAARAARVRAALSEYEDENRNWPPRPAPRERLPFAGSPRLPLLYAGVLGVLFLLSGAAASHSAWFDVGTSVSARIARGEVYRAVTALTLHADAGHLLGNVGGGAVFLWATARRLGAGKAALLTLAAGTIGNLANALLHVLRHQPHASIGASTAVFGVVGILVGTQARRNREVGTRKWTDVAGPWVGGAAILGMLGASEHSDLWAHFFGLVAGAALGLVFARPQTRASEARWVQPVLALVTVAILAGSWAIAFARGAS
jgi:membrane associated rhomboid family serine protease